MMCGWDLGGAHVKLAIVDGTRLIDVRQQPCELWMGLDRLQSALRELVREAPGGARHAVTMTGELTDVFPDRATGVRAIVETFVASAMAPDAMFFDGNGFVSASEASSHWVRIASANWRATAQLVAQLLPQALVIDVGSTTTDLTLVSQGAVKATGSDDHRRLAREELLYTGVVRTPLMVLATHVPFGGEWVAVMAEQFATSADLYRISGELEQTFDQARTADGRGRGREDSMRRLAHVIGCDLEDAPQEAWERLARWLAAEQQQTIRRACDRQLSRGLIATDAPVVGLGVGRFLVAKVASALDRPHVGFGDLIGADRAHALAAEVCGPALAVARLAARQPR